MKNKSLFFLIPSLIITICVNAQTMRAGIKAGSATSNVIITLQPNFNFNNKLNEFGFVIMVPKENPTGTPIPIPTVQILNTCATCLHTTFPAATWVQINDQVSDPNFYLIKLGCVSSLGTAPVLTINNGITQDAVELRFTNSTVLPTQIRLAHLAGGGPNTEYGFSLTDGSSNNLTNFVQMFTGTGVIPAVPHPDETTGYDNTQYVSISNVTLPVNWLSFNTNKQGNDALINWTVGNEDGASYYELQRSINGTDYNTITKINKTNNLGRYEYTDAAINNLGTKTLYYRIKQVDVNGRISYSDIRLLRLDLRDTEINIYPNPAVKGFYVSVPLINPGNKKVKLTLVAPDGKIAAVKEITAAMASNYYFDIKENTFAAGQYNLQIIYEENVLANKKIYINQ